MKGKSSLEAQQRSNIYHLLALFYRNDLSNRLSKYLKDERVCNSLMSAGMILDKKEFSDTNEALALDYTALFLTPGNRIPLNESVYLDAEDGYMGKSAAEVNHFINTLGLQIDANWTDLPDHISVEFEIMQKLTEKESEMLNEKDEKKFNLCRKLQIDFIKNHIIKWIPDICDKIAIQSSTSFYSELAKLTKDFIRSERVLLGI
jgi:TorA maturation chaperone TorD